MQNNSRLQSLILKLPCEYLQYQYTDTHILLQESSFSRAPFVILSAAFSMHQFSPVFHFLHFAAVLCMASMFTMHLFMNYCFFGSCTCFSKLIGKPKIAVDFYRNSFYNWNIGYRQTLNARRNKDFKEFFCETVFIKTTVEKYYNHFFAAHYTLRFALSVFELQKY